MQENFQFEEEGWRQPLVFCDGLGVDSTAGLIGLKQRGIIPDLVLHAWVGSEKQQTYDYIPIRQSWLKRNGFPPLTFVKYECKDFKHWPPYATLEENLLTNCTLPSIAYGTHRCSSKWKISAQEAFLKRWTPALVAWVKGRKVRKVIGFDYSPKEIKRSTGCSTYAVQDEETDKYDIWFALQEWQWDRARCISEIKNEGEPVPVKSSCYFCTAMKPHEVDELGPDRWKRIVVIEARTRQKHLDYAERKGWPKGVGVPLTEGIWRKRVKGMRGATPKPGSMTEYIRQKGLLPAAEIDRLIAATPTHPLKRGDIPDWETWMQNLINPTRNEDRGQNPNGERTATREGRDNKEGIPGATNVSQA